MDVEGQGSSWSVLSEEGERFYLLYVFFVFLCDEISVLDMLFLWVFKVLILNVNIACFVLPLGRNCIWSLRWVLVLRSSWWLVGL